MARFSAHREFMFQDMSLRASPLTSFSQPSFTSTPTPASRVTFPYHTCFAKAWNGVRMEILLVFGYEHQ